MKLTQHYNLKVSKKESVLLLETMKEAAQLWNALIDIRIEKFAKKEKIDATILQKLVQGKFNVHSDTMIALCQRMHANILTTTQNIKIQNRIKDETKRKKVEYPYIKKDMVTLTLKKRQVLKNNYLALSKKLYIKIPDEIDLSKTNLIHITYLNNKFTIFITETREEKRSVETGNSMGVDLGEINSIAYIDTQGSKGVISGREIRAIKRFRNNQHYNLRQKLKLCKKDSKRHKKLVKARNKLSHKSKNKLKNSYHCVTKKFMKVCEDKKIDSIYVGNCSGVGQNHRTRTRSGQRQNRSQFACGELMDQLEYKSILLGIKYKDRSEAWSTQTCPRCGHRYHPSSRIYSCPECGWTGHRDIVGAFNTLRYEKPSLNISILEGDVQFEYPFKSSSKLKKENKNREKVSKIYAGDTQIISGGLPPVIATVASGDAKTHLGISAL